VIEELQCCIRSVDALAVPVGGTDKHRRFPDKMEVDIDIVLLIELVLIAV